MSDHSGLSEYEARRYFPARVDGLRIFGARGRARCPLCNSTNPTALSVDFAKGLFHCFRCGAGGDAITFEMKLTNAAFRYARDAVYSIVGRPIPISNETPLERRQRLARMERAKGLASEIDRWRAGCIESLIESRNRCYTAERRACQIWLNTSDDSEKDVAAELAFIQSRKAFEYETAIARIRNATAAELVTAYRRLNAQAGGIAA